MAKIVIIAPSDADVTDAVKLLKGAGHEIEIEEPTPKTLLHIVLGLMGPNGYGFGPGYAYTGGPEATDDPDEFDSEEAIESDVTADPGLDGASDIEIPADDSDGEDDVFNFEGTTVDGEPIEASVTDDENSTLVVTELRLGPKTSYKINESQFSFWPADLENPLQRVDVRRSTWHTSLEVEVQLGEKTELKIGKDLRSMFEAPKK